MPVEISTFKIIEGDGTIIEAWKGVKDLHGFEWIRGDPTGIVVETREIPEATYVDIQKVPIVIAGKVTKMSINGAEPTDEYEVASFQDNNDGKVYDVSKRLADFKKVKLHDTVKLRIFGCCSIGDIIKEKKKNDDKS